MDYFYEVLNSLLCAYYENPTKDIDGLLDVISQKYNISQESKKTILAIFETLSLFDKKAEERKKCKTQSEWIQKELLHLKNIAKEKGIKNPEQFVDQVSDTIVQSFIAKKDIEDGRKN